MSSQMNINHGVVIATEIVLPGVGEPETLQVRHRELPPLKAGEVLAECPPERAPRVLLRRK